MICDSEAEGKGSLDHKKCGFSIQRSGLVLGLSQHAVSI